jgi:hypothetical protein
MSAIKDGHPPHAWRGLYPKYEIIAVKTICSKPHVVQVETKSAILLMGTSAVEGDSRHEKYLRILDGR